MTNNIFSSIASKYRWILACVLSFSIIGTVIEAKPYIVWKEEIQDQVEARSILDNIIWHKIIRIDIPSYLSYFSYCFSVKGEGYFWTYFGEDGWLCLDRHLLPREWFGQYWFFGSYFGRVKHVASNTLYDTLFYPKMVCGVELTGSKFGQLTTTFYANRQKTEGFSIRYSKRFSDTVKISVFSSDSKFLHRGYQIGPKLTMGVGFWYFFNQNLSLNGEWVFLSPKKRHYTFLKLQYTLYKHLRRDVFKGDFCTPPEYNIPYLI